MVEKIDCTQPLSDEKGVYHYRNGKAQLTDPEQIRQTR